MDVPYHTAAWRLPHQGIVITLLPFFSPLGKLFVLPPRLGYTWQERSHVRPETPRVEQVGVAAEAGSE